MGLCDLHLSSKHRSLFFSLHLKKTRIEKMICGGTGDEKPADEQVQQHVANVKGQVEAKLGKSFPVFEAKTYKSQVVAGRNYFVKVHVGDNKCLHLRIYHNLRDELHLHGVQQDLGLEDPVAYFDQQ